MKRIIALVFALVLLILAAACSRNNISEYASETETEEKAIKPTRKNNAVKNSDLDNTPPPKEIEKLHDVDGVFSVGFEKADITPPFSCPLGGWTTASSRLSSNILDMLYMTFVAFQDSNGQRALLITADNLGINTHTAQNLIEIFAKEGNVPTENVIIGSTHTHSAPSIDSDKNPAILKYIALIIKNGKVAVRNAFNSLDEAEIYIGSKKLDNMNFVRRYVDASGKFLGINVSGANYHETEADNELQIIKFDRKNEKDVVIANWQAHPTMTSGEKRPDVSADYIAGFRNYMEKKIGVDFAFFEGAAGNLTVISTSTYDKAYRNAQYMEYGEKLGEETAFVMQNMTKADSGSIHGISSAVTADYSAFGDKNTGDGKFRTMKDAAFGFGDIAFIAAPYEMFCQNGMNVKNNSPFKMTFICEQANGKNGYLPSSDVYDHGGYEVDTSYFVKGTAEAFESDFIRMLNEIHSK